MSKYDNIKIFPVIKSYDENVYEFLRAFNLAICIADDIIDHQIHTDYTVEAMFRMCEAMKYASKCKGLTEAISHTIEEIVNSERENLMFVPESQDNLTELKILMRRSSLMKLYFECLCFVDKSFDTKENRAWVEQFAEAGLILNDCKDILEEKWEDLIQCRRNYVILKEFRQDIYSSWRGRKDEIILAADKVKSEINLPEPLDKRLKMIGDK